MVTKYLRLLLPVIILGSYFLFGHLFMNNDEITLSDFVKWKIEKKKNQKPGYDKPDEAMKWYYEQRAYPQGFIPEDWRDKALTEIQQKNQLNKGAAAVNWTQLGPGNIGGRIRSIVVHPTDPNIIYLGSVSGGIWKTTNGGTGWFPLKDKMENLAVCSIVMDPTNSNILYAGTGEGYYQNSLRGEGIFKTTDAGATWSRLSSTNNSDFYFVNKLIIDQSTNKLYAATRRGLFNSTNGGTSFAMDIGGDCMDLEVAYTSPSTIFASFGQHGLGTMLRSTNNGVSFEHNLSLVDQGRIEIATSATSPLIAIASFHDLNTNGVTQMRRTTNGGNSWNILTVPGPAYSGPDNYASNQAWYNNIIYIDPTNATTLYAGGLDFWKSTNSGTNWTQKTNWYTAAGFQFAHADQHAIAFAPSNSNLIFLGTDGGIFKSTNKGENWTALNNNLFITQFYYGAVDPTANIYYGGTQDNGTLKSTGGTSWTEIFGGDGGATEVDASNPNNVYIEYVNFAFYKSTNGGTTFVKSMNGIPIGPELFDGTTDRTLFITPFSMDPNNSSAIVGGTYRVWRTNDEAATWTAISGDLTGDGTGKFGASISTVIVAKGNSNVMYVGCTNGKVQVTTNKGVSWTDRSSGLPNAYCTRIATNPNDPATAYATFSGFTVNSKVYKTTNYGANWTNVSSNLPNIPVNCIVVNPANVNNIFVGTDLGVFSTTNSGGLWVQDNTGLPNVAVNDLDYRESDTKLFAATHGRGMFSAPLSGGQGGTQVTLFEQGFDTNPFPPSGWFLTPLNTSYTWKAGNITNLNFNTINPSSVNSAFCQWVAQNQNEWLITPSFALGSGDAHVEFYAAHSTAYLANATLKLNVTTDFGTTWNTIWEAQNDGLGLIWRSISVNITPYSNNQSVYLAWQYIGNDGDIVAIDGIKVVGYQTATDISNNSSNIPKDFELAQNYPNPFNPTTTIKFAIPQGKDVNISIYDITGKKISEVVNKFYNAGSYEVAWNGKNSQGSQVASGTYIYRLQAGEFIQTKKMVFLK